jgi:hypothetical protein
MIKGGWRTNPSLAPFTDVMPIFFTPNSELPTPNSFLPLLNSLPPCVKLTKHGKIPTNRRSGGRERPEGIKKTGFPLSRE